MYVKYEAVCAAHAKCVEESPRDFEEKEFEVASQALSLKFLSSLCTCGECTGTECTCALNMRRVYGKLTELFVSSC